MSLFSQGLNEKLLFSREGVAAELNCQNSCCLTISFGYFTRGKNPYLSQNNFLSLKSVSFLKKSFTWKEVTPHDFPPAGLVHNNKSFTDAGGTVLPEKNSSWELGHSHYYHGRVLWIFSTVPSLNRIQRTDEHVHKRGMVHSFRNQLRDAEVNIWMRL